MDTATLIAQAPAEILLGLGLFFIFASLSLLALSMESDNYPELLHSFKALWRSVAALRHRRRWQFNRPRYCADCPNKVAV